MTAMRALSFGPTSLYLPIGAGALAIAFLLVGFDEYVVLRASKRADEIQTQRFDAWGDWRFYFQPKQWFRRGNHILFLRQGNVDSGFEDITVLEVSPTFELTRRWDARRMEHVVGTRWKLFDVSERRLEESRRRLITLPELVLDLKVAKDKLRIRSGRPEQMQWSELREQIRARRTVGLPTGPFALAMHNRFAYPISGAFAAVVAVGLATRKNRRGHLTTAILEGLAVAMCLWGFMVVARTLVLTDRIPAAIAAWTPILAIAITASRLWMRDELRA
jgi:lipopolysaccharide export system permease protein